VNFASGGQWKGPGSDGSYRVASKVNKLAITAPAKVKPGNGIALQAVTANDTQRWVLGAP
jgi:hypothetical protein